MEEIWKPVKGFAGIYEVSNSGRVRSVPRQVKNGASTVRKVDRYTILSPGRKDNGYLQVALGRKRNRYVHRLVAEAFVDNPGEFPEIDHIDGDRANNSADNLRWVTRSLNNLNPIWREKRSKKLLQIDLATKEIIREWDSVTEAENTLSLRGVSRVCRGERNKCGGYIWRYKK